MAAALKASRQLFMAAAKSPAASKKISPKMPKAKPESQDVTKPKRPNTGILKALPVSPQLEKLCGASEISRGAAVKKIWEYIKQNNLQNPSNKREIICDDKLKTIFGGKDSVMFVEMGKLLSAHFIKTK